MKFLKSKNGVTMISLIFYIASFLTITLVISGITTFFYNNVEVLDTSSGSSSQYNKLNLYMLNECKKKGNSLWAWKNSVDTSTEEGIALIEDTPDNTENLSESSVDNTFITFENESNVKNSFIYVANEKNLYYNSIKLCEDVEKFKFKIDNSNGNTVLKIFIQIDGIPYTTDYVVGS